jgi:hypothetical protein
VTRLARTGLVLILVGTAGTKLLPSAAPGLLSSTWANLAALAELALAAAIVRFGNSRLPLIAVVAAAALGAMVALTVPQPCGCLGPVTISRKTHFLLCTTIGFLACMVTSTMPPGKLPRNTAAAVQ